MNFLVHKTPSYDTKMPLKVVFDKTVIIKFKINNNFKQNFDKTYSKQPKIHRKSMPAYGFLKSEEKNLRSKSLETIAKCLWFP